MMSPVVIPSIDELLGLRGTHVARLDPEASIGEVSLHPAAAAAFMSLRAEGSRAGLDLRVVSGYRSFARQLQIWNGKARGERTLLDDAENELDATALAPDMLVLAILRWSALPGASRHHWGSDFDVVDAAAMPPGVSPGLRVAEYEEGGMFARLGCWLELGLGEGTMHGFFRPYQGLGAGVAREPWHLSYAPVAAYCEAALDVARLRELLAGSGLVLWDTVEASLELLLQRFSLLGANSYPLAFRPLVDRRGSA
jgi:LAS superfamily LD-carboxypeptidase LdcB